MENPFHSIGMAVWAWQNSLSGTFRPTIWAPFILIAITQVLLLFLLLEFYRPGLLPIFAPLLEWIVGDSGTHYPYFFYALPFLHYRLGLVITIAFSSLAVGAATLLFAGLYRQETRPAAWRSSWRNYPKLVVVTGVLVALIYLVSLAPRLLPRDLLTGNQMVHWGIRGAVILSVAIIQCLMAYCSAWIVLKGASILSAIRNSVRIAGQNFLSTFILVLTPILLLYPIDYVAGRVDWFAGKFRPEMVIGLIGLKIVLAVVLGFLLVGSLTRIFLYRVEEA